MSIRPNKQQRNAGNLAKAPRLPAVLTRKNVKYIAGIPRGLDDFERVYQVVLVSPRVTSTLTAGIVATSTTLDPYTKVDSFSRWAAVFKQYLIQKIVVATAIDKLDYANSPMGSAFIRIEEDNAVPTSTIVRAEKSIIRFASFQDDDTNSSTAVWTPASAEDMTWLSTSSGSSTVAFLKTYADPTNTGTSASDSVSRLSSVVYYHLAFRYLAA